jgi:hypothetical protein
MNEQERELDFMVTELEHENALMRARNSRLEAEVTVLTEMVRVLSDKLAQMETKQSGSVEQSVSVGEPDDKEVLGFNGWGFPIEPPPKQEQSVSVGEPVAWMREDATLRFAQGMIFAVGQPFYTTPQQRKPLTDEQLEVIWENHQFNSRPSEVSFANRMNLMRAIEAAHGIKEKNT